MPMSARKDAARNAANYMLKDCSRTDDLKQCLIDRGAECHAVVGKRDNEHRCETAITIETSKLSVAERGPETSDLFDVVFRICTTKKGWRGRVRSIELSKLSGTHSTEKSRN